MHIFLSSDEAQELRLAIISKELDIKRAFEKGYIPADSVQEYSYRLITLEDLFDRIVLAEREQEDTPDPTDDGIIHPLCKDCMKESCIGCDIINFGHKCSWYPEG